MAETFHRTFFLTGPAGKLEATLWTSPIAEPSLAALVCHPHPLYGGTLHNKVVFQTAKALIHRGIPALRFNFRGAGLSEGEHDKGRGEWEDVRAAINFLAGEFAGLPILVAGFSFGAWVGLRAGCDDVRVEKLIGLGIPVANLDMSYLRECRKPKLLIQGGEDQFGPRPNVEEFFATLSEPKKLVIVAHADHFFSGHLAEIGRAIGAWLDEQGNLEP